MDLPFKVFDKKGKAAYDKTKKVLKVTLPVEAAERIATFSSSQQKLQQQTAAVQEIDEGATSTEAMPPKKLSRDSPAKHSRWVSETTPSPAAKAEAGSAAQEGQLLDESRQLFLQVQRDAELAQSRYLQEHQLKSSTLSSSSPPSAVPSASKTVITSSACASVSNAKRPQPPFLPSTSFNGAKAGYVFKRGEDGVGYYVDEKAQFLNLHTTPLPSPLPPVTTTAVVAPLDSQRVLREMPFDVQHNDDTVSFLFQVKGIVPDSVQVSVLPFSCSVRFQALSADNKDNDSNDQGLLHFGREFVLDERQCVGGFDVSKHRHSVAVTNMVLVISKGERGSDWNSVDDSDKEENWLTSRALVIPSQSRSSSTTTTTTPSNNTATSATATKSSTSSTAASSLKSIISTMKFSTDLISELD
jgi:hypothetical protein